MTFLFSVKLLLKEQLHWVCKCGSTLKAWQNEIDMGWYFFLHRGKKKSLSENKVPLNPLVNHHFPYLNGYWWYSPIQTDPYGRNWHLPWNVARLPQRCPRRNGTSPDRAYASWFRIQLGVQHIEVWYMYHTLYELLYIEYVYNDTINKHDDTKTITIAITAIALMYIYMFASYDTKYILYCIIYNYIYIYCTILYYIVLYCIILHYTVLYCIVLYCIVLYCIVLYYIMLYYIIFILCYIILYLYYIMLYYIIFILYYVILYLYSYSYLYLYYVYIIFSIFRYWYPDLPVVPCKEDSHHLSANQHLEANPHV